MMTREAAIFGVKVPNSTPKEWEETANAILNGIDEGWLRPVIDKEFPLEEASKAHEYLTNNPGASGKIVLSV